MLFLNLRNMRKHSFWNNGKIIGLGDTYDPIKPFLWFEYTILFT